MNYLGIVKTLLEFPNIAFADAPTFTPSPTNSIRNAISGAIGTMMNKAPQLFRMPMVSGMLTPVAAADGGGFKWVTNNTGVCEDVPNPLVVLRITGVGYDVTVTEWVFGTLTATIEPAFVGTPDVFVAADMFASAFPIPAAYDTIGSRVTLDGVPLVRVGNREQAMANRAGRAAEGRFETGTPLYWWDESVGGQAYVCVYPVPTEQCAISVEVYLSAVAVSDADVYTSTSTLGLDERTLREILLPLAVEKFMASPLFANPRVADQVKANADEARRLLDAVAPKMSRKPDFGTVARRTF